jgi:hypothetical protein
MKGSIPAEISLYRLLSTELGFLSLFKTPLDTDYRCRHNISYVSKAPKGELAEILKQRSFGIEDILKDRELSFKARLGSNYLKKFSTSRLPVDSKVSVNSYKVFCFYHYLT